MNLLDGTCWLEDYVTPAERVRCPYEQIGKALQETQAREEECVQFLEQRGWKCIPPAY